MITIHQIRLTDEGVRDFNRGMSIPSIEAKHKLMLNAGKNWKPEYWGFYTACYEVDTDDLEHAFEVTNLWNANSIITALGQQSASSSVGDIFERDGHFYIVDSFGFKEVEVSL